MAECAGPLHAGWALAVHDPAVLALHLRHLPVAIAAELALNVVVDRPEWRHCTAN